MKVTLTEREAQILQFAINFLKSNLDNALEGIDDTIDETELEALTNKLD